MNIITTRHIYAVLALCAALLAMTHQPDDSVNWTAGDGAKHYGATK